MSIFVFTKVNCGVPSPISTAELQNSIRLNFNSTLEGSLLEFWCEKLNDSLLSVCLKDGNWRPNPTKNVLCNTGMMLTANYNIILILMNLAYCNCNFIVINFHSYSETETITVSRLNYIIYIVISVVFLLLVIALFTSIVANICVCVKFKLSTKTSHEQGSAVDLSQTTQPIYETAVAVVETTTQEELEVDMEKNLAYAPISTARV